MTEPAEDDKSRFQTEAGASAPGLLAEFWDFLKTSKKWWLAPIFVVLGLVALLTLMSGTAAAPFIYTLF